MTVRLFVEFALWIIAAVALIQLIQRPIRKKCAPWVRVVIWIVKFLAAFAIAYEMIADASPLFWNWGYLFSGLYLALMGDLLAGLRVVGEYQGGDTTVYVSPGIGGWFYPMRSQ